MLGWATRVHITRCAFYLCLAAVVCTCPLHVLILSTRPRTLSIIYGLSQRFIQTMLTARLSIRVEFLLYFPISQIPRSSYATPIRVPAVVIIFLWWFAPPPSPIFSAGVLLSLSL